MRKTKNREIFLVQNATRPFPKHIYRSLRALLNSTLTRNEFGSFQTQLIHKIEGSKPCIYTFYTKTRQIPYSNPYKTLDFHTRIHTNIHISIPMIFFSLPSFFSSLLLLLLPFSSLLLLLLLLPFSSLLLLLPPFSSLVLSLFDLIPFLFHFFSLLEHP